MEHPVERTPQRLAVKAPTDTVPLANPLDLTLTLAPGTIVGGIDVLQRNNSGPFSEGSGPAKLVSKDGTTLTIEVTPVQVGSVDFEIAAVYSDNAFASQTVRLHVVPSAKGLKQFWLFGGGKVMPLVVHGLEVEKQMWLRPMAFYEQLKYPIHLDGCSEINLTVQQDQANPVISVEKNGLVHALHTGKALIDGDFDGVKDEVQVIVEAKGQN
jgi:hypothetical protein